MDFDDTPREAALREEAREWIAANAPAEAERVFETEEDRVAKCKAWMARKAAAGWACISWPRQYGGRGATPMERVIWNQEEGALAALNGIFTVGQGVCGPLLMTYGSDAIKERHLPPLARGEEVWCQLFSEPGAGSDLAGVRTRALREGDEWVIDGQKIWTSAAHLADFGILLARSDPRLPKHRGLTFFFIDMHAPGVEVRPIRQVSGESHFSEVFLTGVRVSDAWRLGEVGEGWKVALTTLGIERLAVGTAFPTNFDDVLALAQETEMIVGSAPARALDHGAVRARLADWYVRASGLKYTAMRILSALSRGEAPGPEASIFKLVLGRGRQEIAALALDILGTAGIVTDPDHAWRDATLQKVFFRSIGNRIEGGTDEIMRNIIAERVLGLPPEFRVDKDRPFNEIPGTAGGA